MRSASLLGAKQSTAARKGECHSPEILFSVAQDSEAVMDLWRRWALVAACCAFLEAPAKAEEITPLAGCYERSFDAAWLKAHPGQIVRRATLLVTKTSVPETPGEKESILADAMLVLWTGENAFSTIGACYWDKLGLACNASLSAVKAPLCKTGEDGPRACRLPDDNPGVFEIALKNAGLMMMIRERLELGGPTGERSFLYLSPDNSENRAFLLQPAPEAACR